MAQPKTDNAWRVKCDRPKTRLTDPISVEFVEPTSLLLLLRLHKNCFLHLSLLLVVLPRVSPMRPLFCLILCRHLPSLPPLPTYRSIAPTRMTGPQWKIELRYLMLRQFFKFGPACESELHCIYLSRYRSKNFFDEQDYKL